MNEKLQNALAEILNKAVGGITAAGDFLQAELPDVIQQLLVWKAVESILWLMVLLLPALWFWFNVRRFCAWCIAQEEKGGDGDALALMGFALAGCAFYTAVVVLNNVAWLKIWLAPKVYLIEYAASLAK